MTDDKNCNLCDMHSLLSFRSSIASLSSLPFITSHFPSLLYDTNEMIPRIVAVIRFYLLKSVPIGR